MNCMVPRINDANCPFIPTSLVLLEYKKNIQGIDVVD